MRINGAELIEGKFYLFNLAKQASTGIELHSVYFVTKKDKKVYEVVFTTPNAQTNNGWYLVEKDVEIEEAKEIPEAEIVTVPSEGGDLSIGVGEGVRTEEVIGG